MVAAMSDIMTKWVVCQQHAVDTPGALTDDVVEHWIQEACNAYLDLCTRLHEIRDVEGLALVTDVGSFVAATLGQPDEVAVSANATEVLPASFTIGVKLRPFGDQAQAVMNVACVVTLQDMERAARELGTDVRDELIALAHAAQHYN